MEFDLQYPFKKNTNQINLLNLKDIAPISWMELNGKIHYLGEFRDLSWNKILNQFLPSSSILSINIGFLEPKKTIPMHENLFTHLLLFYSGSGKLISNKEQKISTGDSVFIPPKQMHSFIAGPNGLHSLCIQLGDDLIKKNKQNKTLPVSSKSYLLKLLKNNEKYLNKFYSHEFFKKIHEGLINSNVKKELFLESIQFWFEKCNNPLFYHKDIENQTYDTIIEIIADWFTYQTLVLDQDEKIAINYLVIRNVNDLLYYLYQSNCKSNVAVTNKFNLIKINDDSIKLLNINDQFSYKRINQVIKQSWNMIDELLSRMYILINNI